VKVRLEIDEQTFCDLLGGATIAVTAGVGRTGFSRGAEKLTLELRLSGGWEALRGALMATVAGAKHPGETA
jgi:hypothetical protein